MPLLLSISYQTYTKFIPKEAIVFRININTSYFRHISSVYQFIRIQVSIPFCYLNRAMSQPFFDGVQVDTINLVAVV